MGRKNLEWVGSEEGDFTLPMICDIGVGAFALRG